MKLLFWHLLIDFSPSPPLNLGSFMKNILGLCYSRTDNIMSILCFTTVDIPYFTTMEWLLW